MILITGATGQVGGAALTALSDVAATGAAVRALVRRPAEFAAPSGVEVVGGSFDDDASLAAAFAGVETLLVAGRDSPESVAQHRRVLAHAARAGVRHIVKLSAIGAKPSSPIALMHEHHEVDEVVREEPADWTLLQPHLYMQNLLRAADAVRAEGRLVAPMGRDRFPFVDTNDVGAAAAVVLGDPAHHAGQTYALTGPAAIGYDEIAAAFEQVAGQAVTYEPVSPAEFQARLLASGLPDWRAFDLAYIASAYSADDNVVRADLRRLLGRAPTSLAEFAERHRNRF